MGIPTWILEGTNGSLASALTFTLVFQAIYLHVVLRRSGWRHVYAYEKAVLALFVAFLGLWLRALEVWGRYFVIGHELSAGSWATTQIALHICGTGCAIVGVLCWLRVTMPWGREIDPWAWLIFTMAAFVVGFVPAWVT